MKKYVVIMAGGVGTRFWPASRQAYPKQFLSLFGDRSLIQQTVDRLTKLIPHDQILIITNKRYLDLVYSQLPEIPKSNVLGEPMAKNTAPCVALASELINQKNSDAVMAVLPADHVIINETEFLTILDAAFEKASNSSSIATIGIKPNQPETGYGYIHFDTDKKEEFLERDVFGVKAFKEKPNLETAQSFLESGKYLWNSGMFIWSVKTIRSAFEHYQPAMYNLAKDTLKLDKNGDITDDQLFKFFDNCESISVDYGIMEHATDVSVVPGDFGWNDVGSWTAVNELQPKNMNSNYVDADFSSVINSSNSYVSSKSGKLVAIVGLKDIAVIETEDAILVCNLNEAQDVKKVVNSLNGDLEKFR